jgi:hypothetical protein
MSILKILPDAIEATGNFAFGVVSVDTISANGSISTTGNVEASAVYSDNLLYSANGLPWQFGGGGGGSGTLVGLTDVNIVTPANNDIIAYNAQTSEWDSTKIIFEKQYTKIGVLVPYTDQLNKFYPASNISVISVVARVSTPSVGNDITLSLAKNLNPVANLTILATQNQSNVFTTPISVAAGEFLNLNINTVGNLIPGVDLYVTMKYYKT